MTSPPAGGAFGPNAWLVDDMFEEYRNDPSSVSESWREFFADYVPGGMATVAVPAAAPPAGSRRRGRSDRVRCSCGHCNPPAQSAAAAPGAVSGVHVDGADRPVAVDGATTPRAVPEATPLRGAAARIAQNMEASLSVPTATSVRTVPAKLLEVNRAMLNQHLARTSGAKVSFTHLIGFAVVQALQAVPALNATFVPDVEGKGTPGVIRHDHVGLGLAVDVEKSDGTRTLLVPVVRATPRPSTSGPSWSPTRTWCARSTPARSRPTTSPAPR